MRINNGKERKVMNELDIDLNTLSESTISSEGRIKRTLAVLSKECKTYDEYKSALIKFRIKFIELTIGACNIIVPEYKFNKMTPAQKNKIFKYLKEAK